MGPPAANHQEGAARGDQELPPYVILGEPEHWASPILDFFETLPIFTDLRRKLKDDDELYKRTFSSSPDEEEHLKEKFACNLPTATAGPVAGKLYLTNKNVAFCSDRPLSFAAPHGRGQAACSYYKYKVMIPLGKIATVEPVTMMDNPFPPVDSHDFWFMGFVSFENSVHSLVQAVSQRSQHGVVGVAVDTTAGKSEEEPPATARS